MTPLRTMLCLIVLSLPACEEEVPPAPVEPAAATVAPATVAPAEPAEEVGPDGPSSLAVPTYEISDDPAVVAAGKAVFDAKGCGACHKFGSKLVGPDLMGLTERRSLVWIARMIRYPEQMTKTDPVAKDLFRSTMVQMTNQGVTDDQIAPLVSYLQSAPVATP